MSEWQCNFCKLSFTGHGNWLVAEADGTAQLCSAACVANFNKKMLLGSEACELCGERRKNIKSDLCYVCEAARDEAVKEDGKFADAADEAHDVINHPTHYTSHPSGIECISVTSYMNFCLGNAMKYIWRADLKGGTEDLKKARWYLAREIALREDAKAEDKS